MPDLLRGDKEQCSAFIVSLDSSIMSWLLRTTISLSVFPNLKLTLGANHSDERVLVVWSDNLGIIPLSATLKITLSNWFDPNGTRSTLSHSHSWTQSCRRCDAIGTSHASVNNSASSAVVVNEKQREIESSIDTPEPESSASKPISGGSLWGWRIGSNFQGKTGSGCT